MTLFLLKAYTHIFPLPIYRISPLECALIFKQFISPQALPGR